MSHLTWPIAGDPAKTKYPFVERIPTLETNLDERLILDRFVFIQGARPRKTV